MGNIRTASTAEYNFNADPEAANIVLERMKCPITLVAWESTFFYMDIFNVRIRILELPFLILRSPSTLLNFLRNLRCVVMTTEYNFPYKQGS